MKANSKKACVGAAAFLALGASVVGAAVGVSACGSSKSDNGAAASDAGVGGMIDTYSEPAISCPVTVSDTACDKTQRPIVFVHGTFGSGDNISNVAQLFGSNGYCQDRFVAIDYNSLGDTPTALIDALIDKVRSATGAEKVDIMGHSQGAVQVYTYLSDPAHAAKVAHYVQLAGGSHDSPPCATGTPAEDAGTCAAFIPTLSLSSNSDKVLGPAGVTGADKTVVLDTEDHFAVASSKDSFVAIYTYLIGHAPQYTDIQCGDDPITLEGKVEAFGDNSLPPAGSKMDIYELDGKSSSRVRGAPVASFVTTATDASIGPLTLKRGARYEFTGTDGTGAIVGHQYLAPFYRSNRLARFLVPATGGLASVVTSAVKVDDKYTVLVMRSAKGAFRFDLNDSLKINGQEALSTSVASASSTTVGLYLFDGNQNGVSDLTAISDYANLPFVKGADVYVPAATPGYIEINYNGNVLHVPNWPSATQGQTLVMFP